MRKIIIFLIAITVFVLIYFNFQNKTNDIVSPRIVEQTLYENISIPGLRNRAYSSNIEELSKYNDKPSYTSYLTSYRSDGYKINGLLTIPKSDKPLGGYPAIVFVHGYIPPTIYKTTEKYLEYVDYLAKNGFVVFKIDLRGHGSSEGQASGAYYSEDYVIDTLNAYSALKNTDFVNPNSIGLWGHSMAGNVTFRSFVVAKNIPALVIWGGAGYTYSDLLEYRIMDSSYRPPNQNTSQIRKRDILRNKYGEFSPTSEFWKTIVPTNYLDGVNGAVSLNHAVDDNVVSIEYSRNLNNILESTSIPHELNEYQSGGHNISGPSFTKAMQNTVNFYGKNLR